MTERSISRMILYTLLTLGIYQLFWLHRTKEELNAHGAHIPTMWVLLIPFVKFWWLWRYSAGIPLVTRRDDHKVLGFVLFLGTGVVAPIVIQWLYNRAAVEDYPLLPRAVAREMR